MFGNCPVLLVEIVLAWMQTKIFQVQSVEYLGWTSPNSEEKSPGNGLDLRIYEFCMMELFFRVKL